ncbi:hypothetical protein [Catenulispora subtropica]|uniref:Uncharacterized protein n=1 Tax=Catenulispora subtropica TaxID=450798 RepID=A0ABN2RFY1_9ACTN
MRTTGNSQRALGRRRISRRDAEALFGAARAGSGLEDVAGLLEAAAGPALPAELSGEDAARAGFSAHHSVSATPPKERRVFSKAMLTKAVTVKIAAAVCGVSVAGAATAAATDSLPRSWQQTAHSALGPIGVPAPKTAAKAGHDKDQDRKGADADKPTPHPAPTGSPAAKPSEDQDHQGDQDDQDDQGRLDAAGAALLGDEAFRLCKAAENGDRDDRGADLTAAELQKLAKAAGIPETELAKIKTRMDAQRTEAQKRMQDFCTRLAQAEKDLRQGRKPHFPLPAPHPGDGWPTTWPTLPSGPGMPTKLPTGLPSKLPTNPPSKLPTNPPTGWPTNWPIDPQNPNDPVHQSSGSH